VPNYGGRIGSKNMPVTHLNADPFIAVKAGRVDTNGFAGKQPADSQRVRPSNAKPFLLTIHSDSKRGGYQGERSKSGDPVSTWIQPYSTRYGFCEIMH
jgi:hypothetical protein